MSTPRSRPIRGGGEHQGPRRSWSSGRVGLASLFAIVLAALSAGPTAGANPGGSASLDAPTALTLAPGSTYHALAPVRVFDSSTGLGGATRLVSETPQSFQMTGAFGIPTGATAVAGTLSITSPSHSGYVALTPVEASPASVDTSSINFTAGKLSSAGVTATLGDDGRLWVLYVAGVAGQTAQVAFDLDGYYAPDDAGATYHPVGPIRVFDSRTAIGGATPLVANVPESFQLAGAFGIPVGATAVTGTLTIAAPLRPGRVALTPGFTPGSCLTISTLDFATTDPQATGVTATLGADGRLWAIYESGRAADTAWPDTAQVIFDLTGYFTPDMTGSTFHPLGPLRLIDSRSGVGDSGRLSSEAPRSFTIVGLYGIPAGTTAVSGTLTIASPTHPGYVALTAASTSPTAISTSSLNFAATTGPRATGVTAPLGADGKLWAIFATGQAGNTVDVIFDLSGYFAPEASSMAPVSAFFETFGPFDTAPRDADGVLMHDYGAPIGVQHNAVTIAQGAISYFDRWQSGQDTPAQADADRAAFFAQIGWLVANQQPDGRWLYTFAWGTQPLPWWSAMAEGLGISAMLRAYSVTGDSSYLDVLERARSTFGRTIANLGVDSSVTVSGRHLTVYQEYLPGYVNNVLNGWIYSLAGLYECAIYLGDPICLQDLTAADRGLPALRALLPYYDTGSWTYYGLNSLVGSKRGPKASVAYEELHVRQLSFLYSVTGDRVFNRYADKFRLYLVNSGFRSHVPDARPPDGR